MGSVLSKWLQRADSVSSWNNINQSVNQLISQHQSINSSININQSVSQLINQHQSINQSIHQSTSINPSINPSKWYLRTDLKQNEAQNAHAESTHKGVNFRAWNINASTTTKAWVAYSNSVTTVTFEAVPLVEFMYLVFTRMPCVSCCKWLPYVLIWYLCSANPCMF